MQATIRVVKGQLILGFTGAPQWLVDELTGKELRLYSQGGIPAEDMYKPYRETSFELIANSGEKTEKAGGAE